MALLPRSCLLLLLLVSAALAQTTCVNTDPCVLDCTGCSPNEKIPDPENCSRFYLCIDGSAADSYIELPFYCGTSEVFNTTTHECEEGLYCDPCYTNPSCVYECPAAPSATVNIPSFSACNYYYECHEDGTVTDATCDAATPYFDGQECQTDEARCCHCHAYCPSTEPTIYFVADPLNCRSYYLCTVNGSVPIISGTCNDGENFDPFTEQCSALAPCVTQCTNVVGADSCIEPFTCLTTGYFPKCPGKCTPEYYHCTAATGEYQDVESCNDGTVFHPISHTCVPYVKCP